MKYGISLDIVDLETGEVKPIDEFSENINNIEFEELVQRIIVLKDVYSKIAGLYRVNEYKFIQMMKDREAKKYVNEEVEIKLSPQTDYSYDTECIHEIKHLVSNEDFDKIFTEQYKVNRNLLKSIYTLGGDIKKLIDKMETRNEKKPTVSVKKK